MMRNRIAAKFSIGLFVILALPPVARLLETYMLTHMFVQIPALIVAGYWIGMGLRDKQWPQWMLGYNNGGVAGVFLAVVIISYWSLPRAIDEALSLPLSELFKFGSNTFLVGIPLALSWHKFHVSGKAFIWANAISMFFAMSWLYIAAPIQICNNYLVNEQEQVGKIYFWLGIALSVFFIGKVMFGAPRTPNETPSLEQ